MLIYNWIINTVIEKETWEKGKLFVLICILFSCKNTYFKVNGYIW